ncbi:PREDICTED: potassium channel subfamily U member 1 [Elephantulus edwardii]|uniref:potassium channel subfamily U member 1 n=1 Tax=Elephantulus edwardii TaxID=28737 RepID=UPI0003F0DA44|nr:PREDICTED: potassium channel subfamily U member 1 [Elephantulus edwardii]
MSHELQPQKEIEMTVNTACTTEIQIAFILSSFVTFFCGLFILYFSRLIYMALKKYKDNLGRKSLPRIFIKASSQNKKPKGFHYKGMFRDRIQMLLSAQTFVGQVLVILVFVLSIGSLIIYFINSSDPVGSCSSYEDETIPIDLLFNAFFSFYFGLRFVAADDKVKFWLEMNSIVDIFTIPPTFISYYLKSNWLGLRFLRALRLLELPKILQILQAIKTSNSVKFSKLLSIILSLCFTAAGFIHLVENSGDPWLKGRNSQNLSYFDSIYLIVATTSTVGFGDVVAKTFLGRAFLIFLTFASLILFAKYVPEVVELFANKRKYTNSYEVVKGKKFIVVCGNITVDSVSAFLSNFLRYKSGEISTDIVFLGENPPSLELETIFKCHTAYTTFVNGSALKWDDLKRVAVEHAEAFLIIANPLCSDAYAEDTSNIMRVLSIKNYYPKSRVIIQILQSYNKVYLSKIPSWNWKAGDNIICFTDLKLGFIAQGCLVPGLCTFLTSLFIELNIKVNPKHTWQKQFLNGLRNKILTQRLSDDFAGMTFAQVSRICFVKMNLMLIAIESKSAVSSDLVLNPPAHVRLCKNTIGFFIAESAKEVKRALFYCSNCHSDVTNPELIERCGCKSKSLHGCIKGCCAVAGPSVAAVRNHIKESSSGTTQEHWPKRQSNLIGGSSVGGRNFSDDRVQTNEQLDSSGMFHWCKAMPLDKVILKRSEKRKRQFRNHVVACVFGDAQSNLMGLRNFVMPLRASNYTLKELKDIVFIGSLDYLQREWRFLRNFPQLYILPGSALFSGDLREANIEECSMCVVLCPPYQPSSRQILVDTETVITTLNVGALRISCYAQTPSVPQFGLNFTGLNNTSKYRRIPILTELKNPSNIRFIEPLGEMKGVLPGPNLHLSTSFSTGAVFSGSFLDSLLATAFYNYHVLELLQMLVTGGVSSQLAQNLDKDKHFGLTEGSNALFSARARCKLGLLSLNKTVLSDIEPKDNFGQVFCGSLDKFGILCLGLYRMIDEEERNPEHKRFVITRPPTDLKLLRSDLVYCAIPFGASYLKKDDKEIYESTNLVSLIQDTIPGLNYPSAIKVAHCDELQYWHPSVLSMDQESRSSSRYLTMAASTILKRLTSQRRFCILASWRVSARLPGLSADWLPNCGVNTTFHHQWVQAGPDFSVETDYTFPLTEKVNAFLADPSAFVTAAPVAAAATATIPAAAAAPAKVEAKEESEESNKDMEFGLFD